MSLKREEETFKREGDKGNRYSQGISLRAGPKKTSLPPWGTIYPYSIGQPS